MWTNQDICEGQWFSTDFYAPDRDFQLTPKCDLDLCVEYIQTHHMIMVNIYTK